MDIEEIILCIFSNVDGESITTVELVEILRQKLPEILENHD